VRLAKIAGAHVTCALAWNVGRTRLASLPEDGGSRNGLGGEAENADHQKPQAKVPHLLIIEEDDKPTGWFVMIQP